MPILAGGLLVAPEVPEVPLPDVVTPPTVAYREHDSTMSASWIDPDGTEWPLSTTTEEIGWFTMNGPAGWGATPVELIVDPLPRGGEQVRHVRSKPRRIQWPLYVFGRSHQEFTERYRRIVRAFTKTSQRLAPGWLRVTRPDGRYRQIACYYEQGLEGESGQNQSWARAVVTLYCPDGYWSGDRPVRAYRDFTGGTSGGGGEEPVAATFYNPFMTVGSSKLISSGGDVPTDGGGADPEEGATEVVNTGDVEAWPTWTIRGPMSKITAENLTLGSRFSITYNLAAEQTIAITTNRPTVRGPGDANLARYVDWFAAGGAELWPLTDGVNRIRFRVDGAATGTQVELLFTPRFETA